MLFRSPRAAFPSGCLAAQTKRWAEGMRDPAPLAGGYKDYMASGELFKLSDLL